VTSPHAALHAEACGRARDLVAATEGLRRDAAGEAWLLDSALPGRRLGRFSFAGAEPWAVLRVRGDTAELDCRRAAHPDWPPGVHRLHGAGAEPLALLRRLLPRAVEAGGGAGAVPFAGGAVGLFAYEWAERLEPVRLGAPDAWTPPDLVFLLVDAVLALEHGSGRLRACGLGMGCDPETARAAARRRAAALARRVARTGPARALPGAPPGPAPPVRAHFDAAAYAHTVEAARQEILRGEIYQACLTQRLEVPCREDPWMVYRRLRHLNPAPFAAFLELPELVVLSSSPERFLRLEADGRVEARPIKGTRPAGTTPDEERAHHLALAGSEKDRAENVMIVDLYRNDLGRVCETGSVAVPELFAVERYATVHQMVSTVTGRLARGRDALDLVHAAFPPGSMTGAPKIAAMRILARLEPVRRGVYAGALGYLDARGGMDLSVVIRTVVLTGGRALVHAGGGVVADSDPMAEYRESMDKARALLWALGAAPGEAATRAPTRRRGGGPAFDAPLH